jgi:hypothetical protein
LGNTGGPAAWYEGATPADPLAEFNGADHWVNHPARDGIALVGDAAASVDPNWETGLSFTLLDVLHLRNALCASSDWSVAIDLPAHDAGEADDSPTTITRLSRRGIDSHETGFDGAWDYRRHNESDS